jgi:transposase
MTMVSERVDAVIGVDTHTDTHTAAICDAGGGVLAVVTVTADEDGYTELLDAAAAHAPGPVIAWGIEGAGSYGAELTEALHGWDQEVIEVRSAARPRGQGKTDRADAVAIARAALGEVKISAPRRGDTREALRVLTVTRHGDVTTRTRRINALKALVLTAPAPIRDRLRGLRTPAQVKAAAALRGPRDADLRTATCVRMLAQIATQIRALDAVIAAAEAELDRLTRVHAAPLRAQFGIGPVSAAQILITYSHPGRFRSEAAFASIAGTAPLEASSGKIIRHRLNRTGDRQLNAALHRVINTRRAHRHPETLAYIQRRATEQKTPHEIQRCLKRALTRRVFRLLETMPALP